MSLNAGTFKVCAPSLHALSGSGWTSTAKASAPAAIDACTVGSPGTVAAQMRDFVERTQADELMVVSHIYDQSARLRSYEIAAATMTESSAA